MTDFHAAHTRAPQIFCEPNPTDEVTVADRVERLQIPMDRRRPTLTLLSGIEAGRQFALAQGRTILGRGSEADVVLDEDGVSRQHCAIDVYSGGQAFITDLRSTNGTGVDGQVVGDAAIPLTDGALLALGGSLTLKFALRHEVEEKVQHSLYNAAVRDGLTGLYNKRYLQERMEQEFAWALRNGRPLSILVVDLDFFKRVNDQHGHPAGDEVLRVAAGRMQEGLRREDVLARFGGEEFVILMRETPAQRGWEVGQRVAEAVRRAPVHFGALRIPITASMGLASSEEPRVLRVADLFARADRRLYKAKSNGRNQVVARD